MRLAGLAARPGGRPTFEPALLRIEFTRPLEGDVWRSDLDDGWTAGDGLGIRFESGFRTPLGKVAVVRARFRATAGAGVADRTRLLEGGVWGETGPFAWAVGRQRFFWSPSTETSLLLSNNAPPLDAVSAGSRGGWRIPGGLGTFRGKTFLAYLDDEHRTIPYPLLWGAQIAWQPAPSVRLEIRRTALFGGAGRTSRLTPRDVVNILLGLHENDPAPTRGPGDSDQLLSYALRWRWPLPGSARLWLYQYGLRDLEVFYEYAGEDGIRRGFPTAVGRNVGLRADVLGWEIYGAYALNPVEKNRWYEHVVYRTGYRYRGWILGHPGGGDMRWIRGRFGRPWLALTGISLEGTWEEGGVYDEPKWEAFRTTGRIWKTPMPGIRLELEAAAAWGSASEGRLPERFPRFSLHLSAILGDVVPFAGGFDE